MWVKFCQCIIWRQKTIVRLKNNKNKHYWEKTKTIVILRIFCYYKPIN